MKIKLFILIALLFVFNSCSYKKVNLQAGPMLGYTTDKEAMIWIKTDSPAYVQIKYWSKGKFFKLHKSEKIKTLDSLPYTAHILLQNLEDDQIYFYNIYIDGKKIKLPYETKFKTKKSVFDTNAPPEYTFALGSTVYIIDKNKPDPKRDRGAKGFEIFNSIANKKPDFMIWLGDNVRLRDDEFTSMEGFVKRYTHDRSFKKLQRLLATCPNYAIWDDHDFGPNDSCSLFPLKEISLEIFKLFWANPSYGVYYFDSMLNDTVFIKGAITHFKWYDSEFFLLDNRFYRDCDRLPKQNGNKTILGEYQLKWLKYALKKSKARYKFIAIGGQFLNPTKKWETYANYGFDKERQEIINFIINNRIRNVVFLTGDRHFSELRYYKKAGIKIYDLTVSPLTNYPAREGRKETKVGRVPKTLVTTKRNFAIIKVTGTQENRRLEISVCDTAGTPIWTRTIIN